MIPRVVSSPNGSPDWIGLDNGILLEMYVQTEPKCVIDENNDLNTSSQTV